MADLSYTCVSQILKLDTETGKLFWRERPREYFRSERDWKVWNTRYAGRETFINLDQRGYLHASIFKKEYRAHRVVWILYYGEWPNDQVDHINGDKCDNRPVNLRVVSNAGNGRNQKRAVTNTSGVRGVSWHKWSGKWQAQIYVSGKWVALGYFKDFSRAVDARKIAEQEFGFHPNHGR